MSTPAQAFNFMEATPAQTVSNQFVSQFYTVLHTSPRNLHRFYSEASTLTIADTRQDGQHIVKTVTGQKNIHETVMSQGLEETVTEVYSVDSQYSLNGGVVVQVTGAQSNKGGPKRPFVQTFFLAVQEKGFYVMNDMFRYLPDFRFSVENGYPAATALMQPVPPKTNGMAQAPPAGAAAVPPVPAAPHLMTPAPMPSPVPVQAVVPPPQPLPHPAMSLPVPLPVPVVQPLPVAQAAAPPLPGAVPPPVPPLPQLAQQPQQPKQQQPAQPSPPQPPQQQEDEAVQPQVQPPRPISTEPPKPEAKSAETGVPLSYAERLKQGRASVPSSPTKQPAPSAAAPAAAAPQQPAPVPAPAAAAPPAAAAAPPAAAAAPPAAAAAPPAAAAAPPAAAAAPPAAAAAPVSLLAAVGGMERSASQSGSEAGASYPMDVPTGVSVFLREIPPSVTIEELVSKLSAFGPLRPNGVNLKTQRGKDSYAFVDFETVEAAQACMDQGLDFEGGHHVNVVEKRPMFFRSGSRTRGGAPTGFSGRGDRGAYRGGRAGRGPYQGGPPMMLDGGRGIAGRGLAPMGPPPMAGMAPPPMRGRGDGRVRYPDSRGRGRGPAPPMV